MAQLVRYRNINSIKILYIIGNCFCILPIYNFSTKKFVKSFSYDFYACIILIAIIIIPILSLCGRIREMYPHATASITVVDVISLCLTTLTNFVTVSRLSLWKREDFKTLLVLIAEYDEKNYINSSMCVASRNRFYLEVLAYHLLFLAFWAIDGYVWMNTLGFKTYRTYLFRNFQYYQILTLSFIIHNFAVIIKNRFTYLNEKLVTSVKLTNKMSIVRYATSKRGSNQWNEANGVKDVIKLYNLLTEIVDTFNKVFGQIILLLMINNIAGLLQPLNLALVYFDNQLDGINYGLELNILCGFWAMIYLVSAVIIGMSCDQAAARGKETASLSYKLIQELPTCTDYHNIIKDDLMLLAEQASNQTPCFSAAGFFVVNYTMLTSLIGSVTAYIVVLIQFKN